MIRRRAPRARPGHDPATERPEIDIGDTDTGPDFRFAAGARLPGAE